MLTTNYKIKEQRTKLTKKSMYETVTVALVLLVIRFTTISDGETLCLKHEAVYPVRITHLVRRKV